MANWERKTKMTSLLKYTRTLVLGLSLAGVLSAGTFAVSSAPHPTTQISVSVSSPTLLADGQETHGRQPGKSIA